MPQFFKENNPIISLGLKSISVVLETQYQQEERTRLLTRAKAAKDQLFMLLTAMRKEVLSTDENILTLSTELAELYEDDRFKRSITMGDLVATSLEMLELQPLRKRHAIKTSVTSNLI